METGKPAGRHYGMDWLRIGAFQLLILYHVGMAFVPWGFSVKVSAPIGWTVIPMFLTNPWRVSLLFAVSGFASAALLERSDGIGTFLRSRMARLGIPLLAGILIFVAWNMGEWREFAPSMLLRFTHHYRLLMLGTFFLTVVFDLTVAVR